MGQSDVEYRVSFTTDSTFERVLEAVGSVHNYDTPMIVADTADATSGHCKGLIAEGGNGLAEKLAATRLVACAQGTVDGTIAVKTTADSKAAVEQLAPAVEW